MARPDGRFAQNPAGINSMLFYHATIIIHGKSISAMESFLTDMYKTSFAQTVKIPTLAIRHRISTSPHCTVGSKKPRILFERSKMAC